MDTLMKRVVSTSSEVRFTVTTASKKKGWKKLVAYTMPRMNTVGRKVVRSSLMILLFITIFKSIPRSGSPELPC